MSGKRNLGFLAAFAGLVAMTAVLAGSPAARADELADLRANQQLLQQRIDQLAQAQGQPLAPEPGPPPPLTAGLAAATGSGSRVPRRRRTHQSRAAAFPGRS